MNEANLIQWFEFLAIFLNLVAGLLLAPEAIGKEKMEMYEQKSRHSLIHVIRKMNLIMLKVTLYEKKLWGKIFNRFQTLRDYFMGLHR